MILSIEEAPPFVVAHSEIFDSGLLHQPEEEHPDLGIGESPLHPTSDEYFVAVALDLSVEQVAPPASDVNALQIHVCGFLRSIQFPAESACVLRREGCDFDPHEAVVRHFSTPLSSGGS